MTGSLATQDGLFGCMETTRGRSQHVAYIELITNMLSQRLPFLVISSAIMPFLQPERRHFAGGRKASAQPRLNYLKINL